MYPSTLETKGRKEMVIRRDLDKVADVLYIMYKHGNRVMCVEDEDNPDILYRYDIDKREIVGVTVLYYSYQDDLDEGLLEKNALSVEFNKKITEQVFSHPASS